ncbi:MAG: 6-phosphogluconolactonase [Oligoflexia bacterium]|nr:6-phosphogluconolactonase [Oligoflexia bacterium]
MNPRVEEIEAKLFAGVVADEIIASLNDAIADKGRAVAALSGGRTPGTIYRALSCPPRVSEVDWSKVVLLWGDERWVPKSDGQSNFKLAHETLLGLLSEAKPTVHAVDTSLKTPALAAAEYAKQIKALGLPERAAVPVMDLVLLGMGEDGHTASVFPHSGLCAVKGELCRAVKHPSDGSERVTMLPEFLFAANRVLFIVSGSNKSDTLRRVLRDEGAEEDLPARCFKRANERVTWFVDSAAAQGLQA